MCPENQYTGWGVGGPGARTTGGCKRSSRQGPRACQERRSGPSDQRTRWGVKAPIPLAVPLKTGLSEMGTGAVWQPPGASCWCPGVRGGDGSGSDPSAGCRDGET